MGGFRSMCWSQNSPIQRNETANEGALAEAEIGVGGVLELW